MTNIHFTPIANIHWAVHLRLIPAFCYQQILTMLYFASAFVPEKLLHYLSLASENGYDAYQKVLLPLWQNTAVRAIVFLAALPLLSFITFITFGLFAVFWPLLVVGSTCSVISFTSGLLVLNNENISAAPTKQFAYYLLTLIPLACLGYIFSPLLWCTLFLITAYHSITNPRFSSIPSLSTAGSRWLGLGCGLLLITAPYWTVWHIVTFPLCFFLTWMAQFCVFVGCNVIARGAPSLIDSINSSYLNFVNKHSVSISMEKEVNTEKLSYSRSTAKESYEQLQKIEHHN